jgi:hypothetical protein
MLDDLDDDGSIVFQTEEEMKACLDADDDDDYDKEEHKQMSL